MKSLFFLKWGNREGQELVLPDAPLEKMVEALEEGELQVLYGGELSGAVRERVGSELALWVEMVVGARISDRRFAFYILVTALVFLASFYFLSYLVRDPLPLVDEFVLSLLLAGLALTRLRQQDRYSQGAIQESIALKASIAGLPYRKEEVLCELVLHLEQLSQLEDGEVQELLASKGTPSFFSLNRQELLRLFKVIQKHYGRSRGLSFRKRRHPPRELAVALEQMDIFFRAST